MYLLVSVTDAAEALEAVAGGAALIDVKNPAEGALGAAAPGSISAVRAAVPPELPVSAAIGDFGDQPGTAALAAVGAALAGADLVKVGLLGSRTAEAACRLLTEMARALAQFRPTTGLIACAYADAERIGGLPPSLLPAVASAAGCAGAMIDTYTKAQGTTLFTTLAPTELAAFTRECRDRKLIAGLAGSLQLGDLAGALALAPDYAGVRGAACGGDRAGRVSRAFVERLINRMQAAAKPQGVTR